METDELVEDILALWRIIRRATYPAAQGELTLEQFWLLRYLRRQGDVAVGELADAIGIAQSSVTVACQRLEKAGLVTRTRSHADERVVQISLTPTGHERIERWRQEKRDVLSSVLAPLEPAERAELQRLMSKILDATPVTKDETSVGAG
jgi:DNA-binding MarR family transcriptional regulator